MDYTKLNVMNKSRIEHPIQKALNALLEVHQYQSYTKE